MFLQVYMLQQNDISIFVYRERLTTVQACLGFKTFLFQICPSEGFVKVCPVGWIPTTHDLYICTV